MIRLSGVGTWSLPCRRRAGAVLRVLVALLALLPLLVPAAAAGDDGDLDFGFGLFGKAVRDNGRAYAVVARADGSLRVAIQRSWQAGFMALEENGALDTSFGVAGVRMVTLVSGAVYGDRPSALFERPTGELLMVAITDDFNQGALVQVTADGDLDPDFGTGGIRYLSHGGDDVRAYAAALQSDGKVLVAGMCYDCGPTIGGDTFIARYTSTGSLDTTFGTSGWVIFDAVEGGTEYDYAMAIAIDYEGRILVGGGAGSAPDELPYVARRLANGGVDTSFAGSDGIRTLTALAQQHVTGIAVDPVLEKVFVSTGEKLNPEPATCAIARLRDTGSLDTSWSGDGIVPLTVEEGSNLVAIALQSDGKIVAAGSLNPDLAAVEGFLLVRLLADGTLDPSFDDDGRKRIEFDLDLNQLSEDYALAMTLTGGRILAVGIATEADVHQVALTRVQSALIFMDGFERGSAAAWAGN